MLFKTFPLITSGTKKCRLPLYCMPLSDRREESHQKLKSFGSTLIEIVCNTRTHACTRVRAPDKVQRHVKFESVYLVNSCVKRIIGHHIWESNCTISSEDE